MDTRDLFQNIDFNERHAQGKTVSSTAESRIGVAAHKLAIFFTERANLPPRYKRRSALLGKPRKVKDDSDIEKRFKATVESWRRLIETMLAKSDERQAWRFINLSPQVTGTIEKVTESKDFCDFVDYLILRRDNDKCGADELGGLALLSVAFQRVVEKRIQS